MTRASDSSKGPGAAAADATGHSRRHAQVVLLLVCTSIAVASLAFTAGRAAATPHRVVAGCSVQAVVRERFPSLLYHVATLIGLGNCGKGIQPRYTWDVVVRDHGKTRHVSIDVSKFNVRLFSANSTISGTFTVSAGSDSMSCNFVLPPNAYEAMCPST
jgi:hypothetical protein